MTKAKNLKKTLVILFPVALLLSILACSNVGYQVIDNDEKLLSELQQNKPFVLGCGEAITVTVWRHEEASADAVIAPDGKISLPLIGEVTAAGLTVDELKDELNKRYRDFINEPHVTVTIKEINSLKIYVTGEVTRPGELKLNSTTDVLQAISLAGGFTIYANRSNIKIIRKEGDKKIKINFNYNQVVKGKNLSQNIPLKAGDVIVVSESW
jgi:polysaccharide export outer membrane protein